MPPFRDTAEFLKTLGSPEKVTINIPEVTLETSPRALAASVTARAEARALAKVQRLEAGRADEAEEKDEGDASSTIKEVYHKFCAVYRSDGMTNTIFAKFCKETKGVLDKKKFKLPQIDMVWTKAVGKAKKATLPQFVEMLEQIAVLKGFEADAFKARVVKNAKVKSSGTKGESKFFDDKSKWTGVALQGGPDSTAPKTGLAALANRDNKANVRGQIA